MTSPTLATEKSSPPLLSVLMLVSWLLLAGAACADDEAEAERIAAVLRLEAGMVVADVGAGDGEWSVRLARRVGPGGRVIATEVKADLVAEIAEAAEAAGLENVDAVLGDQGEVGLPADCCDAVLLRMVYHHFQDPAAMRASLRRALRPGARLAIIDIEPQENWRRLEGVPERGGHGIPERELIAEMAADGFEAIARYADWKGEEDRYCVVFRLEPARSRER